MVVVREPKRRARAALGVLTLGLLLTYTLGGCAAAVAPPGRIMLYGDSLCSQFGEFYPAMQREFPGAEIIADGFIGAATWDRIPILRSVNSTLQTTVFCSNPKPVLIIVLMGVNNFAHDRAVPPEWGWSDIEAVRTAAHRCDVPIFIGTPLPYARTFGTEKQLCSHKWSNWYVEQLRTLILRLSQPEVIDFAEAIPWDHPEDYLLDCLHPNEEGARRMAALVRATICDRHPRREFTALCTATPN